MLDKKEVLAEFYNLSAEILLGKAQIPCSSDFKLTEKQENSKRIIKSMIATGQQEIMVEEFKQIEAVIAKAQPSKQSVKE